MESQWRPERTPVDAGAVEHADRARLLPQRSLPTVLGLQAAQAGGGALGEVDALGHALAAGAVQEIRAHAPRAPRWDSGMDQAPPIQRRRCGNEQQDQVHQPSVLRVPHRRALHCSHLSLLRSLAAARRTLITLLGEEPKIGFRKNGSIAECVGKGAAIARLVVQGRQQGKNVSWNLGALPPNPRNLALSGQNSCWAWTTREALERRIGLRRNATRAPSQAPEWLGRLPSAP